MNLRYRILWVEDQEDFIVSIQNLTENAIKAMGFIPEFVARHSLREVNDNDDLNDPTYDLIMLDYKLDSTTSGTSIATRAREMKIYTEIVLYSANFNGLKEELRKNPIQGIYYIERRNFRGKIIEILGHIVKKHLDMDSFRGVFLSEMANIEGDIKRMLARLSEVCETCGHSFDLETAVNDDINTMHRRINSKKNNLLCRRTDLQEKTMGWMGCCLSTASSRYDTIAEFGNHNGNGQLKDLEEEYEYLKVIRNKLAHEPNEGEISIGEEKIPDEMKKQHLMKLCDFSEKFNSVCDALLLSLDNGFPYQA